MVHQIVKEVPLQDYNSYQNPELFPTPVSPTRHTIMHFSEPDRVENESNQQILFDQASTSHVAHPQSNILIGSFRPPKSSSQIKELSQQTGENMSNNILGATTDPSSEIRLWRPWSSENSDRSRSSKDSESQKSESDDVTVIMETTTRKTTNAEDIAISSSTNSPGRYFDVNEKMYHLITCWYSYFLTLFL